MRIALLIYVLAFLLATMPKCANAFSDYDVDWTSNNSKESILRITIDNCTTKFTVKNEDLDKFTKNREALTSAIKKAIERSNSGCKN
jgi:hypothetical protein